MPKVDNIDHDRPKDQPEGSETPDTSNILTESGARQVDPPGTVRDALYMSPDRMKALGLENVVLASQVRTVFDLTLGTDGHGLNARDKTAHVEGDRVLCHMRNHLTSDRYEKCESDRYWQIQERYPSAQVVYHPGTDRPIIHQDGIYYTVSRQEYEAGLRAEFFAGQDLHRKFKRGEIEGADPITGGVDPTAGLSALEQSKAEVKQLLQAIHQKWPAGMSLEEIEQWQGADKVLEDERRAAMGSRGERSDEKTKWAEWREKRAKELQDSGRTSKKRSYSFAGQPTR